MGSGYRNTPCSLSPGSSPADSINRAQYCVHVGLPDYTEGDDTGRTRPVNMPTAGSQPQSGSLATVRHHRLIIVR